MSCVLIELVSRDKNYDSGNQHRVAGDTSPTPRSSSREQRGRKPQTVQERVQVRLQGRWR